MPPAQQPQSLLINRFYTGLVTQRNPLVTPVAVMGMSVVPRHDALIDGLNVEVSNSKTLQRRPGFPRYCSAQLGVSEAPVSFSYFRKLDGTVSALLDTNTNVYTFTTSALTSIMTKSTAAQTHFLTVGSTLFMSNGTDLKKWDGTTLTNWGIIAASIAPSITIVAGSLSPKFGYTYVYVYKDAAGKHISTASPISGSTGAQTSKNFTLSGSRSTDPQVSFVDIYRTLDGGSTYFYLATVANPGAGSWTYTDSSADSALNNQLIAPLAHVNDPPPASATVSEFHMGHVWLAVGNTVNFSAGPDTINGDGNQSFPPANFFTFKGQVMKMVSTTQGMLVFTTESLYVVLGVDTTSFYPATLMPNFGVLSPNCVDTDGGAIYVYTNKRQLFTLTPNAQPEETGYDVGNILLSTFNPATSYLTVHRSGTDAGIFLSDGSSNLFYYSLNTDCWSPLYSVAGSGGVKAIKSVETTAGNFNLMLGRASNNGFLLSRNLTTFTDDNTQNYTGFATIGSVRLSQPGEKLAELGAVCYERMGIGSDFSISVLTNDISGTFVNLPNPVPEPPQLSAIPSTGVVAWRHNLASAQQPLPQLIRHIQVKITLPTEAVKNELLGVALAPPIAA